MKPLRFFYIPNEGNEGDQVGPRQAFAQLQAEGVFRDYTAYSYFVERRAHARHDDALIHLLQAVERFQPDVIFWQHLNRTYPVDATFLRRLKSVASRPKLVWHDPDPYGRWIKPIDPVMCTAIREADAVVVKGLGYLGDSLRRIGARRVIYAVESYDDQRFDTPWTPTEQRPLDVVMIANLTCLKRVPFLFLPGGRTRRRLADRFAAAYGARFAVHGAGQGWSGRTYCRGPVAFDDQERTLRSAWISVNWSQFDTIPMYFSDRLPISLASGVPHITNHQRGFDQVLPGAKGVFFVHSPAEALDVADMLLSLPRERLVEIGQDGARYAREHLNAVKVYGDLVRAIRQQLFPEAVS